MRRVLFVMMMALGTSCVDDVKEPTEDQPGDEQASIGGVSLSLVATDSQGRTYRLRNATFTILPYYYYWATDGGAEVQTLSTESNPTASRLSVRLLPGQYLVSLGGDWYVERTTESGVERVQKVVLLSQAEQYTYVSEGRYTDLEFRFGVDGDLIDFLHGDLNVNVAIELPGERYDAGHRHDAGYYGYGNTLDDLDAGSH